MDALTMLLTSFFDVMSFFDSGLRLYLDAVAVMARALKGLKIRDYLSGRSAQELVTFLKAPACAEENGEINRLRQSDEFGGLNHIGAPT